MAGAPRPTVGRFIERDVGCRVARTRPIGRTPDREAKKHGAAGRPAAPQERRVVKDDYGSVTAAIPYRVRAVRTRFRAAVE